MKKFIPMALAFLIVALLWACVSYIVGGKIFGVDFLSDWGNDVLMGLSCSLAGMLGPIIARLIRNLFGKRT